MKDRKVDSKTVSTAVLVYNKGIMKAMSNHASEK